MHTVITDAAGLGACVEDASGQPFVGLDTETTGLDPFTSRVRLVQIATPERVWVVDCFAFEALSDPRLVALLEAERPIKILHNAKFDARMLDRHAGGARLGLPNREQHSRRAGRRVPGQSRRRCARRYAGCKDRRSRPISQTPTRRSGDWRQRGVAKMAGGSP